MKTIDTLKRYGLGYDHFIILLESKFQPKKTQKKKRKGYEIRQK